MQYKLRQKMIALFPKYFVLNEADEQVYIVRHRAALYKKFILTKPEDKEPIITIKKKPIAFMPTFFLIRDGQTIATIRSKIKMFGSAFRITTDAGEFVINGNIFDLDYAVKTPDDREILTVDKKFISLRDTYTITIPDPNFELLGIAIAVVVDIVHHSNSSKNNGILNTGLGN